MNRYEWDRKIGLAETVIVSLQRLIASSNLKRDL
jgi:hypothetical protein